MTAFEKYLLEDKAQGVGHLMECLMSQQESMVWDLVERLEGPDWKVNPEDMLAFLAGVWDKLKAESEKEKVD